jgi:hypothetical protein
MLADETVQMVKQLLASTMLSQREIARRVGVNRETVNRIAHEARFDAAEHKRAAAAAEPNQLVEPIRCHGCGGLIIVTPCPLCKVRKMIRQQTLLHRFVMSERAADLRLRLLPPHIFRYQVLCAQKIQRGEKPASNLCLITKFLLIASGSVLNFANVKYCRWFMAHARQLSPLLDLPEQLDRAGSLTERWKLLKAAGDLVLQVVERHPVRETGQVYAIKDLRLQMERRGLSWDKFLALLPTLVELVDFVQGRQLEG